MLYAWLLMSVTAQAQDPELGLEQRISEELLRQVSIARGEVSSHIEVLNLGFRVPEQCPQDSDFELVLAVNEDFRGKVRSRIRISKESKSCFQANIQSEVAIYQSLPHSRVDVPPGAVIDVVWKEGRYDLLSALPVAQEGVWVALAVQSQNSVVTVDRVKRQPDAFDGSAVGIEVRRGNLVVRSKGKLMSDCFIGKSCRVLSVDTGKSLEGNLLSPSLVVISY